VSCPEIALKKYGEEFDNKGRKVHKLFIEPITMKKVKAQYIY
jgi:hypothetical protein